MLINHISRHLLKDNITMTQLFIISANHINTSSQERLMLRLTDTQWEQLTAHMEYGLGIVGDIRLQTCNRLEIIYEHHTNVSGDIVNTWLSLIDHIEISEQHFDTHVGTENCIAYLLDLSLGFHSALYGDDQILQQLKKAFESARSRNKLSSLLERAYQTMMRTHKQVCRSTDYKSQTVSLAYQALKATRKIIGKSELAKRNLLIVGAGDMANQVLKCLPKFQFNSVAISNRTESKAKGLAEKNNLKVVKYNQEWTNAYEVVISCTDHGLTRLSELRSMDLYVDLSLASAEIEDLHVPYVLLEELQGLISAQNNNRMACVPQVQKIIKDNKNQFLDWYNSWVERKVNTV